MWRRRNAGALLGNPGRHNAQMNDTAMVTGDQATAVAHSPVREVNGLSFVLDVTLLPSCPVVTELAFDTTFPPVGDRVALMSLDAVLGAVTIRGGVNRLDPSTDPVGLMLAGGGGGGRFWSTTWLLWPFPTVGSLDLKITCPSLRLVGQVPFNVPD